jgi:hypothetical protein
MNISKTLYDYYVSLWGEPSRIANYDISNIHLDIYKWNADMHPEEVAFYVTNGLSNYQLNGYDSKHRMEFFIGFSPEEDRIVESLATLAVRPLLDNLEIGNNHTMTFPEPLWRETKMQTLIISKPNVEIIAPLVIGEEVRVDFMQVLPLFPNELQLKKEKGADYLFKYWEEKDTPFWDPNRTG